MCAFELRKWDRFLVFVTFGIGGLLTLPSAWGQSSDQDVSRIAQDPSARPPPPDDPTEADVAKRKRFGWEFGRKRLSCGLMNIDSLKAADDDIPKDTKANLLERWSSLLADDLKPLRVEVVRWYARWGHYSLPDVDGKVGLRLDLIVAEWSVRGVLVRASHSPGAEGNSGFLVRLPKRAELQFRPRPRDTEFADAVDYINWEFVPTAEVRNLLMELFHWPDPSDALFRVHGQMKTCAGVNVFAAQISTPRAGDRDAQGGTVPDDKIPAGPVPDRILITDSDPQYVCLSFDLGEEPPQGQQP